MLRSTSLSAAPGALLLLATTLPFAGCDCSDDSPPGTDSAIPRDSALPVDSGLPDSTAPTDSGTIIDSGSPADSSVPADGGTDSAMPTTEVRFVVMGDVGTGSEDQHEVGDVIADLHAAEGVDFVILLGDNIYNSGVSSITDPQWTTKFETPYENVPDIPFYAVLGNHDYGGELPFISSDYGGLGNEFDLGPLEVAYSDVSAKWEMPETFYTFQYANVGFIALDTNSILWDDTTNGDQLAWWPTAMAEVASADWVITLGHHPYLSNGAHGNAGDYESIEVGGVDIPIPVPIMDGENVKEFFDDNICGVADISFAGHDHNRQWIDEPSACGGTELIVSGAGAKTKDFDRTDRNATHWQDADTPGFMYVVIDGDSFYGRWMNQTGATEFEQMFTRTP